MNEVATKKDLKHLENKMDTKFSEMDGKFNHFRGELRGDFSRWAKVIHEDGRGLIKPVIEMQQEQGKKIDSVFEMTAQNTEDFAVVKTDIRVMKKDIGETKTDIGVMKSDINIIKNDLK